MPHVVAKNEKKIKGKIHLLGTQTGDREELRVTGHLPEEAGAALGINLQGEPWGSGAPLEETAWMVSGVLCSLKEGPSPPGGSSEPGWPFRTKQGAVQGEAHWMPAALRIGWLPWRPLSGVKSASEEGS